MFLLQLNSSEPLYTTVIQHKECVLQLTLVFSHSVLMITVIFIFF